MDPMCRATNSGRRRRRRQYDKAAEEPYEDLFFCFRAAPTKEEDLPRLFHCVEERTRVGILILRQSSAGESIFYSDESSCLLW